MSLISKAHLNLTLQSIKKLLSGKADKSELELKADKSELELKADELQDKIAEISENIVQPDWNQHDETASDYVKNRTHWEETSTVILVDSLTSEDYRNGNYPNCTFVPGQKYNVVWNSVLYEDLVCWLDGDYNIIASQDNGCQFYIDDDGGNGLYIGTEDESFTVSISTVETITHKLDPKYIPDDIGGQADWNQNDPESVGYIANRTHYEEVSNRVFIDEVITIKDPYYENTQFYYDFGRSLGIVAGNIYNVTFLGETFTNIECDTYGRLIFKLFNGATIQLGDNYINSWTGDGLTRPFDADIKVTGFYTNIHKLDEKYFSDAIARVEDVMSNYDPVGTGSFSMNRKSGTHIGYHSHAEGYNTTASGNYSHAEGRDTTASGDHSHAEGYNTTASGDYSHVEGNSTASGNYSHAEGRGTASGDCSHAEGYHTTASGDYSHAEGYRTTASGDYSHVQGKMNIQDDANVYAHIVGNGNDNSAFNRVYSNAHTLDWNGVGWFQGGLQVGGNAQDDGAKNVLLEGDAIPVPETAEVGQVMRVKSVDENGKPVEWETTDISTSGGSGCVVSDMAPEDTSVLWIDTSDNSSDENLGGGNVGEMEQLNMLIESDMLPAVHDANGAILTDENGKIILKY